MDRELRHVPAMVRALPDNVEETRTVEFTISTSARDRYGTVLNQKAWQLDNFNRNGIVGYQHHYGGDMCNPPNPDDVLGAGRAWLEGDELIGSVTFEPASINPLAEKVFRKVLFGTLKAASVGFMPTGEGRYGVGDEARDGPNETYYFEGQELYEWSIVNLPGNPEALRRSFRDQTAHALMYVRRVTGLPLGEIERMSVRDVLAALDHPPTSASPIGPVPPAPAADLGTAVRDALQTDNLRHSIRSILSTPQGETHARS